MYEAQKASGESLCRIKEAAAAALALADPCPASSNRAGRQGADPIFGWQGFALIR